MYLWEGEVGDWIGALQNLKLSVLHGSKMLPWLWLVCGTGNDPSVYFHSLLWTGCVLMKVVLCIRCSPSLLLSSCSKTLLGQVL